MGTENVLQDIFEFSGIDTLQAHTQGLIRVEKDIRDQLGTNAHLLDAYLELLLNAMNEMDTQDAVIEGFEAGKALMQMIRNALGKGRTEHADHSFAARVWRFIKEHPLEVSGTSMRAAVYYIALSDAWRAHTLKEVADKFQQQCRSVDLTVAKFDYLRSEIQGKLEDKVLLDRMTEYFLARHGAIPPLAAFSQGMAAHLNYEMLAMDSGGTMPAFRVWLDSGIGSL